MKLWDKGFSIDKQIEKFTVGNDREIDMHIAKYDVQASLAHAIMLASIGIITTDELNDLKRGLQELSNDIENGTFTIEASFEDVHSKIEWELTNKLGEVGKKIHTARSRNDQVLVALQLYYKENLSIINDQTKRLFDTLLSLADSHKESLLPGYTHLQVAMPSYFGLWFSAYAELLIDDVFVLNAVAKVVDQNPLGSAAGYGSSFPIDRELTTKELEFTTLKYNVVAAQLSRGKSERSIASALGGLCNTMARFSMDVCLYMSQNFNFISFPDELTTGSSIMPHKKNPDIFELIRGKCALIQGLGNDFALLGQNLPSGYHREMQLFKGKMLESIDELKDCLTILNSTIQEVRVRTEIMTDAKYTYAFTVEALNELVQQGVPFRDAYKQVGLQVEEGPFKAPAKIANNHIGSLGTTAIDKIQEKLDG